MLTETPPRLPTANSPLPLQSTSYFPPLLRLHSLTVFPQFLLSQTFTLPSAPAVAMYRPHEPADGSTEIDWTGPTCARSLTCGVERFGDQSVTVPDDHGCRHQCHTQCIKWMCVPF